jgi:CheY-like chemotaxis protein
VQEGTGIGLVVCKRLVELMAGRIGVASTLGTGSTFWIELALAEPPQAGAELSANALAEDAAIRTETPLRTVLYVEDNPANLMLIEDLLARRPDIRFLSAMDGTTGVALARSCGPDVILMDVNLPGISGIQAMLILKNDPNTAHIPVVALSANAIPRDINKGLQAGFFRYLTKPIKVVEFMATLEDALQLAAARTISPQEDVRNA